MTGIMGARIESSILSATGINQIQSKANRLSALQFRDNLKWRFEGRIRRQKFARRDSKYNKNKQKQVGHINPLVLTGAMRRSVLTRARVTATSKQGRMITTTGANGFRTSEWRDKVRTELEQVTLAEEKAVGKLQEQTLLTLSTQSKFHKKKARRF